LLQGPSRRAHVRFVRPSYEADAHLGYTRLHLAEGNRAAARVDLDCARKIIHKTGYHRRDEELKRLEAMIRDQLLDALCKLLESELAILISKIGIPPAYLPGAHAPPASRIIDLLSWADRQGRLAEVEQLYLQITGLAAAPKPAPAAPAATIAAVAVPPPSPAVAPAAASAFPFPQPLLDAYHQNKLAILFGSGLSIAKDVTGDFPRWDALPDRLLDQAAKQGIWTQAQIDARRAVFKGGYMSLDQMLTDLDAIKTALRGHRKYQAALSDIFRPRNAGPGDAHRALVAVGAEVLATTNYDELLEHVEGSPARAAYTWKDSDKALSDIQDGRKVLFKIHGSAEKEDTVVMTRAEYTQVAAHVPYQHAMSLLLQSYTFLLVGYGINDPFDLDLVFDLNTSAFGSAARTHYALVKNAAQNDRDRWQRDLNVQVLPYQDHGDLPGILRALRATKP
jgi:hypothetical protein